MKGIDVILNPRTASIGYLIDKHLDGKMTFSDLEGKISDLGYKTTSLYEMVIAAERSR